MMMEVNGKERGSGGGTAAAQGLPVYVAGGIEGGEKETCGEGG